MNMKTRIAKFLITLSCFSTIATVNAFQGSSDPCCGPCYDPCCPSSDRCFFVDADYIYWTARQDGLGVNRTVEVELNGDSDCRKCGNCHSCNDDWNSGFKVGAGFANPCCDWELYVQYTYYRNCPNRKDRCKEHELLTSSWCLMEGVNGDHNRAQARWDFRYNNVDALISSEFCVNNCFTLRPSFGLKGAWHCQDFNKCFCLTENSIYGAYKVKHKQDFWGVGPKFALTAAASLFDCFSVYGNAGISVLWSEYDVQRSDCTTPAPAPASTSSCDNGCNDECKNLCKCGPFTERQRLCRCACFAEPVLEGAIGVRWDTDLCCGDYGLWVKVAWEHQVWFEHNRFIRLDCDAQSNLGNLTLQGVTAGVGFSF